MSLDPMTSEAVLYYPHTSPPDDWLRKNLLLFDSVTTLVPPDDGWGRSETLRMLEGEGLWYPTFPTYLGIGSSDPLRAAYTSEVFHALDALVAEGQLLAPEDRGGFPLDGDGRHARWSIDAQSRPAERLFLGKLMVPVEEGLLARDLARVDPKSNALLIHPEVATVILSITAKYFAEHGNEHSLRCRTTPSTDVVLANDLAFSLSYGTTTQQQAIEVTLEGLWPTPSPDTDLSDIVAFRRRHREDLIRCRQRLDEIARQVTESESPIEVVRRLRADIEADWLFATRERRQSRIELVASGAVVLLVAGVALPFAPGVASTLFSGAAVTGIGLKALRARTHVEDGPLAYLFRAAREFT